MKALPRLAIVLILAAIVLRLWAHGVMHRTIFTTSRAYAEFEQLHPRSAEVPQEIWEKQKREYRIQLVDMDLRQGGFIMLASFAAFITGVLMGMIALVKQQRFRRFFLLPFIGLVVLYFLFLGIA